MLDTRRHLAGERWILRPLAWGQHSETGPTREVNEDAARVMTLPLTQGEERLTIAAVADGMGGHAAGEVASRVAVDSLLEELTALSSVEALEEADILQALQAGFANANLAVQEQAEAPMRSGMGSTLTAVVLWRDRLLLGHIGDSRVYRLREGRLEQLTRDHSVVQEKVDLGLLTPEEALRSVQRNQLRRAIGTSAVAEADVCSDTLAEGDAIFLATDGAYASLEEDDFIHALSAAGEPQRTCDDLAERAAVRDGSDNVTLVCIATETATRRGGGLAAGFGEASPTVAAQGVGLGQRRTTRRHRILALVLAVDVLAIAAIVSFPVWRLLMASRGEQQRRSAAAEKAALTGTGASSSLDPGVHLRLQVRLEGNTVTLDYLSERPLQAWAGGNPSVPLTDHAASAASAAHVEVAADSAALADQTVGLRVTASSSAGEGRALWSLTRDPDRDLDRGSRHLRLDGRYTALQGPGASGLPAGTVGSTGPARWPVNDVVFYVGEGKGVPIRLRFSDVSAR